MSQVKRVMDISNIIALFTGLNNEDRTLVLRELTEMGFKFEHPELQEGEVFLINVRGNENFGCPPFCESIRRGNVAYATGGVCVVPDMNPLFGKLKEI